MQSLEELDYVGIAPHPRREPPEVGERFYGKNVVTRGVHVARVADPIHERVVVLGDTCQPVRSLSQALRQCCVGRGRHNFSPFG
jgi:hypothetical protein